MAKVIEFYIPDSFPKRVNCIARVQRGKVIDFRLSSGKELATEFRESTSHDPRAKEGAIPMWTF